MVGAPLPPESEVLRRVIVRLIRDDEKAQFDQLLEERHYLHSAVLAGQNLRYVAELDGHWLALLTFSAAALHLKGRERWIGWTAALLLCSAVLAAAMPAISPVILAITIVGVFCLAVLFWSR